MNRILRRSLAILATLILLGACNPGLIPDQDDPVPADPLVVTENLGLLAPVVAETLAADPALMTFFLDRAADRFDGATDVLLETLISPGRSVTDGFRSALVRRWEAARGAGMSLDATIESVPDLTLELSLPPSATVDDVRGSTLAVAPMRYDVDDTEIDSLIGYLPGGDTVEITLDYPEPYILLSRNDRLGYGGEAAATDRVLASPNSKLYLTGASMKNANEFGSAPEIWLILGTCSVYDPATSRILTRKDLVDFNKSNRWWECRIDLFSWSASAPDGAVIAMWFEDDPDWWWTTLKEISVGFSAKNESGEFSYEKAETNGGAKEIRSNDDYMGDAVIYYEDNLPATYSTGNVAFQTSL